MGRELPDGYTIVVMRNPVADGSSSDPTGGAPQGESGRGPRASGTQSQRALLAGLGGGNVTSLLLMAGLGLAAYAILSGGSGDQATGPQKTRERRPGRLTL